MDIQILTSIIAVLVTAFVCWLLKKAINKRKVTLAKWNTFLQDGVEVDGALSNFHCDIRYGNEGEIVSSVAKGTLCFVTEEGETITRNWRGRDVYLSGYKQNDKHENLIPVKVIYNKDNVKDNVVKEELVGFISRFNMSVITLWFFIIVISVVCFLFVAYRGY